jgi:WD40 repeat protein
MGHASIVISSPDGSTLASTNGAEVVELWDLPSRKQIGFFRDPATVTALAYAPDGSVLAVGNEIGNIALLDMQTNQTRLVIQAFNYDAKTLTFLPTGKYLASGGIGRKVKIWDVTTGKLVGQLQGVRPPFVHTIDVSSDGSKLAIGTLHGPFSIWDLVRDKDP